MAHATAAELLSFSWAGSGYEKAGRGNKRYTGRLFLMVLLVLPW
jgi:hypothetical protein